jgi:hypothetical protein
MGFREISYWEFYYVLLALFDFSYKGTKIINNLEANLLIFTELICIIEREYVFVWHGLKGKSYFLNKYLAFYERSIGKRIYCTSG